MCEHDYRIIKTTGEYWLKKCFKCGDENVEYKIKRKKKSLLDKILGR